MYINSVVFNRKVNCIDKGSTFTFRDLNIIVGDQGCGKSTLLSNLMNGVKNKNISYELSPLGNKGVDSFYFDSEHDNPRLKDPQLYTTPCGKDKGIGYNACLTSKFKSHGEILKVYTVNALRQAKKCVIILDEPESGLSVRNQYNLAKEIQAAVKRKCQLFVATHCLPLIQSVEEVLSLEHNQWMFSENFLNTQTKE